MKKIYLSILMTLCPLLPGMAQQLSQHGRETVCLSGLRTSAAQTPMPFLQEGKEWYTRCVHYFLGEFFHTERIEGDTILDGVAYKKLYDGNVVEGFLREENGKVFPNVEFRFIFDVGAFFSYYPISISAFAKYIGMNASLLRQYAAGIKVPQSKSLKRIRQGIAKIKGDLDAGLLIDKPVLQYV